MPRVQPPTARPRPSPAVASPRPAPAPSSNGALARVLDRSRAPVDAETLRMRRLVADLCRVLGAQATGCTSPFESMPVTPDHPGPGAAAADDDDDCAAADGTVAAAPAAHVRLSPRVRQTLDRLLHGDSEKQVARRLHLSQHTVHVYVKALYRKLNVNSRGELLAKFVRPHG